MELRAGVPAPDFTLPLATVGTISLSNMRGKPVVLYFYPKDDTPGCTTEACSFRDIVPRFADFDAAVIGISKDSVESHVAFAKKYGLNFHLASDEHGQTCEDYGAWREKNMYGKKFMGVERSTFLIDGHGVIRHIWRKVSVDGHAEEVRQLVERLHHGLPLPQDPPSPMPASGGGEKGSTRKSSASDGKKTQGQKDSSASKAAAKAKTKPKPEANASVSSRNSKAASGKAGKKVSGKAVAKSSQKSAPKAVTQKVSSKGSKKVTQGVKSGGVKSASKKATAVARGSTASSGAKKKNFAASSTVKKQPAKRDG